MSAGDPPISLPTLSWIFLDTLKTEDQPSHWTKKAPEELQGGSSQPHPLPLADPYDLATRRPPSGARGTTMQQTFPQGVALWALMPRSVHGSAVQQGKFDSTSKHLWPLSASSLSLKYLAPPERIFEIYTDDRNMHTQQQALG